MSEEIFDSEDTVEEFKDLMRDPAARQAFVELRANAAEGGARSRYTHILQVVGETPWAIRPAMLGLIIDILAFRAAGGRLSHDELEQRIAAARRPALPDGPAGVAVIPVHGVIVPKAGMMTEMSGGTSIEGVRSAFRRAMSSNEISSVVFDFDSPGGMVDQVPEMAAEIRSARGIKPMVAVADSECASAAYWLATQADRLVVTRSARVGSIGVFTAHEDESVRKEQQGVKTTLISAGKYKTEGNPFEPLTVDARNHMQEMVDNYYGMFVSDVARGRGVPVEDVRNGFGQGRVEHARSALKLGMADQIGTLEGVLRGLLADPVPVKEAAEMLDMSGSLAMDHYYDRVVLAETIEEEPEEEDLPDDEGEVVVPDEGDDTEGSDGEADDSVDSELLSLEAELAKLKG